jgi:hypothetical protein
MSQPQVIYASQNPLDSSPNWGATVPTKVPDDIAFSFWPNLVLSGNNITVTSGPFEPAQYLFSSTFQPGITQTFTFTRQWAAAFGSFTPSAINATTDAAGTAYSVVLTHAADNIYTATLMKVSAAGNITYTPVLTNLLNVPDANQWRNVKTVEYAVTIAAAETLQLETVVTNIGLPGSTSLTNPGMFTWTLQLY